MGTNEIFWQIPLKKINLLKVRKKDRHLKNLSSIKTPASLHQSPQSHPHFFFFLPLMQFVLLLVSWWWWSSHWLVCYWCCLLMCRLYTDGMMRWWGGGVCVCGGMWGEGRGRWVRGPDWTCPSGAFPQLSRLGPAEDPPEASSLLSLFGGRHTSGGETIKNGCCHSVVMWSESSRLLKKDSWLTWKKRIIPAAPPPLPLHPSSPSLRPPVLKQPWRRRRRRPGATVV